MKEFILNRKQLFVSATAWWLLFVVLSLSDYNSYQLLNIVGIISLIVLPGVLTLSLTYLLF